MNLHPNINNVQFTVQFMDINIGHVLDQNFNPYSNNSSQQVYAVFNSLKAAIENAEHKQRTIDQHNFNVGYYVRNSKEQVILHTDGNIKTIIINSINFSDEEGFYTEMENILTSELNWKTGRNLNAFNDLLRGGFSVHEYEEPIQLVWLNSDKSKNDLDNMWEEKSFYTSAIEIIKSHPHILFEER